MPEQHNDEIKIRVLDVVGKGRPRASIKYKGAGQFGIQIVTPKKTRAATRSLQWTARVAMKSRTPIVGPVAVEIRMIMLPPASWSKARRGAALYPTTKPDIDNVAKTVFDAFNHVVWKDDSQVTDLVVCRRYSLTEEPGLEITVRPIIENATGTCAPEA